MEGHAEKWRMQVESIAVNEMVRLRIQVPEGINNTPKIDFCLVRDLSYACYCEIFVHSPHLLFLDFIIKDNGDEKEYVSVRTPSLMQTEINIITGVEILTFGKGAQEALLTIQKYIQKISPHSSFFMG
jgi:hypothetical protein